MAHIDEQEMFQALKDEPVEVSDVLELMRKLFITAKGHEGSVDYSWKTVGALSMNIAMRLREMLPAEAIEQIENETDDFTGMTIPAAGVITLAQEVLDTAIAYGGNGAYPDKHVSGYALNVSREFYGLLPSSARETLEHHYETNNG